MLSFQTMAPKKAASRRGWGKIRTIGSGRLQASYISPIDDNRHYAPTTYDNRMDAEAWLTAERRLIEMEMWTPPADRAKKKTVDSQTLEEFMRKELAERDIAESTRALWQNAARIRIYSVLGQIPVTELSEVHIHAWWRGMGKKYPTARRHAYLALHSSLEQAIHLHKIITENPSSIVTPDPPRHRDVEAITPEQLDIVASEVLEHYRAAVYVLAWSSLRFGELIEIRRKDIFDDGVTMKFSVRRGGQRINGNKVVVAKTKTARSERPVTIPPHVAQMVREHMTTPGRTGKGPEAFLFTTTKGNRLSQQALMPAVKRGYRKIGRGELRIHDLRAVGATFAAQAGATTKELMARLGHTTPVMAMKYQHASLKRDEALAEAMSAMVTKPRLELVRDAG